MRPSSSSACWDGRKGQNLSVRIAPTLGLASIATAIPAVISFIARRHLMRSKKLKITPGPTMLDEPAEETAARLALRCLGFETEFQEWANMSGTRVYSISKPGVVNEYFIESPKQFLETSPLVKFHG